MKLYFLIFTAVVFVYANEWPPVSEEDCSPDTKQKAMHGKMTFDPPLSESPMTSFEVDVEWNDLKFHPTENMEMKGGMNVVYTLGMKNGPEGRFGIELSHSGGQFMFSMTDGDRTTSDDKVHKSSKLAWPIDTEHCKRHCQNCEKDNGLTTGTYCSSEEDIMMVGDKHTIKLERISEKQTINTKDFGGFEKAHQDHLNEGDREITGSIWSLKAIVKYGLSEGSQIPIGTIMIESEEIGFDYLGTFDEMVGCNKCNAIYHKDTRYGPYVGQAKGFNRVPLHMNGTAQYGDSTCKQYYISGSQYDLSVSFESGPFAEGVTESEVQIW